MAGILFSTMREIRGRALFLGERLDLREMEKSHRLASNPLLITAGLQGCAVLFRYGALVLFGLSAVEEAALIETLRPSVSGRYEKIESEDVLLILEEEGNQRAEEGRILLHDFSLERLQLVAEVLARSVVLDYYESNVAESFKRIEPLAMNLQRSGRPGSGGKMLLDRKSTL